MNTLSYIVIKVMIIAAISSWILVVCKRRGRRKAKSTPSSSYIEEDTKLEEKFIRPSWDKEFPNILPPPTPVPEKENKEVDVELDMMMSGPQRQNNTDARNEVDLLRSDILDPNGLVLLDRTQGSFEPCQEPNRKRDGEKPPSLLRPAKSAMVNSSMRNRSGKRSSLKQCTVKKTQTIPSEL